jgi:hypothetical protein
MEISRKDIDFLKQLSIAYSLVQVNQIPLNLKKEFDLFFFGKTLMLKDNVAFAYPQDIKNWVNYLFQKFS